MGRHKKYKRLFIAVSLLILLTSPFATYKYWLPEVADYLIIQNKLSRADVIVAISGDGIRYQYAVKLFKEGYAKYILFNYNEEDAFNVFGVRFNPEEEIKNFVMANSIPLDKVISDGRPTSTYEDILYAKENIIKNQFKTVIFVSSNYHMRRVYLTFEKVFKENDGVRALFAPVPKEMEGINPDTWWTMENDLVTVFNEYVKLALYWYKYGI